MHDRKFRKSIERNIFLSPSFFFSNYSRNTPTYYIPQRSQMYQQDKPIIFPITSNHK